MALTEHYHTKFEEGRYYHVYNRTVDRQPMFKTNDNYKFFLKKYDEYLSPILDTYSYCLLGNHFHFLIRVQQDLTTLAKLSNLPAEKSTHTIVSHQWQKFFQSYAMAFNKQHNRVGTLFQTPFKRVLVDSEHYYTNLIYYIHINPQLHKLVTNFKDWNWSSYGSILANKPTKLKRMEVMQWFGNATDFENFHLEQHNINVNEKYILEDER